MTKLPLIVSLYAGPGTGKSTTASLVFGDLKQKGYNVELVHEVAKDLTWEERWQTLAHQPYVIAKQLRNYDRLNGQVDAIITDTSPLLGLIYLNREAMAPEVVAAFSNWVLADWKSRRRLNVFLERNPDRTYNPAGRSQTEQEAVEHDSRIKHLLYAHQEPLMTTLMDTEANQHVSDIVEEVELCLRP